MMTATENGKITLHGSGETGLKPVHHIEIHYPAYTPFGYLAHGPSLTWALWEEPRRTIICH